VVTEALSINQGRVMNITSTLGLQQVSDIMPPVTKIVVSNPQQQRDELAARIGLVIALAHNKAIRGIAECPSCRGRLLWRKHDRFDSVFGLVAACSEVRCSYELKV
jgi:hypothetical protein